MSFLRRLLGAKPSSWEGMRRLSIQGEAQYQDALIRVSGAPPTGEHSYECTATLVLEADDPLAVMVQIDGERVGHLPRRSARRFGSQLRAMTEDPHTAQFRAFVDRGPENPNLGVSLRIPYGGPPLG